MLSSLFLLCSCLPQPTHSYLQPLLNPPPPSLFFIVHYPSSGIFLCVYFLIKALPMVSYECPLSTSKYHEKYGSLFTLEKFTYKT